MKIRKETERNKVMEEYDEKRKKGKYGEKTKEN